MRKYKNAWFFILLLSVIFIISLGFTWFLNNRDNQENFDTEKSNHDSPSFHVLIATMGRDSIFNMLGCLKKQLKKEDYLTIVFDGPNSSNVDAIRLFVSDMKCNTNVIVEENNLGYWGHAIRNKHNQLSGDFVFHVDDDDIITDDCMETLRKTCKDKNTIYIFKMKGLGETVWVNKSITKGQIGTPMGIIPTHLNSTSEFTHEMGGDYKFYKKLEKDGNNIEYVDKMIYIIKPLDRI